MRCVTEEDNFPFIMIGIRLRYSMLDWKISSQRRAQADFSLKRAARCVGSRDVYADLDRNEGAPRIMREIVHQVSLPNQL